MESLSSTLTVDSTKAAIAADNISFDGNGSVNVVFNGELRTMGVYNVFMSGNAVPATGLTDIHFFTSNELPIIKTDTMIFIIMAFSALIAIAYPFLSFIFFSCLKCLSHCLNGQLVFTQ